ncbi:PDZ domain-containing protein [bacterium]|nr:PDZ domain-containing protein [bacterium]
MKKLIILAVMLFLSGEVYASIPIHYMQIPSNPLKKTSSGVVVYTGVTTLQGSASAMLPKAVNYYKNGNLNAAIKEIDEIILCCPDDAQALFLRSQINYALENLDKAIEDTNKAINISAHNKLYIWRIFLSVQTNDQSRLNQIAKDIETVLSTDDIYGKRVINGYYNEYIWKLLADKNISSDMISAVFKTLIKLMNDKFRNKYNNTYTIPVLANYIQYIYTLDETDKLFIDFKKDKKQILQTFINMQQGQYSTLIAGLLTYASGDTLKGSEMITSGFYNVEPTNHTLNHAYYMAKNTINIIRPWSKNYITYGIGIAIEKRGHIFSVNTVLDDSPAQKKGVKQGDKIISVNGVYLDSYKSLEQVSNMIRGQQNSAVKINILRPGKFLETSYTVVIPRTYVIKATENIYYNIPNIKLKNGRMLSDYVNTNN